ncbi:hypothetical protein MOQ_005633 [Trypanosoma cruzi marinkellei]|uniref:Transmembrane protein n=1 Tax=Trypanosoma cruzi marinkellei TaxID=85056 RepID=K2MU47_TRYCR|nr:hypothetical protein MOQ_005633 [Trypanosoma cruzi marinkellei]
MCGSGWLSPSHAVIYLFIYFHFTFEYQASPIYFCVYNTFIYNFIAYVCWNLLLSTSLSAVIKKAEVNGKEMVLDEIAARPTSEVADVARSLAVKGNRVEAVYIAHEILEENLAKLPVMIAETRKPASSYLDPWKNISETLESLCQEVELCLQLFSMGANLQRFKGLRTVATLYDQKKPAADRLRGFFLIVSLSFTVDEIVTPMPARILRKFAQVICTFDAIQAAEWLSVGVQNMLDARRLSQLHNSSAASRSLICISVFGGYKTAPGCGKTKGTTASLMTAMLTLLIRCRADAGVARMEVRERERDLRGFLEDGNLKSLLHFESVCATVMEEKKQRIQEKMARRTTDKRATPATKTDVVESKEMNADAHDDSKSYRRYLHSFLEYFWGSEWKQSPSRIVLVVAGVILLLLMIRQVASIVARGLRRMKGLPHGARKTLTL